MKYVFLGAPGVGKGTQAAKWSESQGIPHISTGSMLRAAVSQGSELGARVQGIIESGSLIPDDLMVEVIKERIKQADCRQGYILDGFPRTVAQAEALQLILQERGETLDIVLLFDAPEEELLKRLAGRRGEEGRADDSIEVQRRRLQVYEDQTRPLIDYYDRLGLLRRVDSVGGVEEVFSRLWAVAKG